MPVIARNCAAVDFGPPPSWDRHFVIAFCDGDHQQRMRCNSYLRKMAKNQRVYIVKGRFRRPCFPIYSIFRAPLVPIIIQCFSNGKTTFQSSFMSITAHLFAVAGVQRCIEKAEVRLFVVHIRSPCCHRDGNGSPWGSVGNNHPKLSDASENTSKNYASFAQSDVLTALSAGAPK
jgi:hypothetical protein